MVLITQKLGVPSSWYTTKSLKSTDFEKSVMFEEATINANADISKDRRNIFRFHKLSKEDKVVLYSARPDLNPKLKEEVYYTDQETDNSSDIDVESTGNLREPLLSVKNYSNNSNTVDKITAEIAKINAEVSEFVANNNENEEPENSSPLKYLTQGRTGDEKLYHSVNSSLYSDGGELKSSDNEEILSDDEVDEEDEELHSFEC